MAKMGDYCKAYPVSRFREFSGWTENLSNLRKPKERDGEENAKVRSELTDSDYLYLQEDFTVTDGIFLEQNVIFDNVTPEWKAFCLNELKFEVPVYETA